MRFYEVFVADGRYRGQSSLTYSYEGELKPLSVVTVPLRQRMVTGFVTAEVKKPGFDVKPIKNLMSQSALPAHSLKLAQWLSDYYAASLSEALRQFAPVKPSVRQVKDYVHEAAAPQLELEAPLTTDQQRALKEIKKSTSTTILLHGETGSGKTKVYMELAKEVLANGKSAMILTPEIALTGQLAASIKSQLANPVFVFHSQLGPAERKKIWLAILEAKEPVIVIGARSALFSPVQKPGLIVLDEAHEPAYKQDQSPRYHAARVASQLGVLTGAKVILGTATPTVTDYYLAQQKNAIVRMEKSAVGGGSNLVKSQIIDIRKRENFGSNPYISKPLIEAIKAALSAKKQIIIYLNRRGSARQILCDSCGWQFLCPNCDIPLVYHGDEHLARCHICGFAQAPPGNCPECKNTDIIYKSIGTKALVESLSGLFQDSNIKRFDGDNLAGERVNELYSSLHTGEVDILVGTQLLAKGLDLPHLGLVGIITAETALALPDYTAEERYFQLLYQIIGRVGRGHGNGEVVVQTYNPGSIILKAAAGRDWQSFYKHVLSERQKFRFPPYAHLMQIVCRRATVKGAETAILRLKGELSNQKLPVEIIGPTPSFYARRGKYYYWQLVLKSKNRQHLVRLAKEVPADFTVNLDPTDLL